MKIIFGKFVIISPIFFGALSLFADDTVESKVLDVSGVDEEKSAGGQSALNQDEQDRAGTAEIQKKTRADSAPPPAKLSDIPPGASLSGGERITIDDRGFSIVAPVGWIVQRNLPRSSLYLQARVQESEYPRNISVVRFTGSKMINIATAEEFSEKLVKSFPSVSTQIENYSLRNHQAIQMEDGRDGLLFYTDFMSHGRKMMQAHVLLSSETNHYLVTFTDYAEHFENPDDALNQYAVAWNSMTSIQLDSATPQASQSMKTVLFALLGVGLIFMGISFFRAFVAARSYNKYGSGVLDGDDDDALKSTIDPSAITNFKSRLAFISEKAMQDSEDDVIEGGTTEDLSAEDLDLESSDQVSIKKPLGKVLAMRRDEFTSDERLATEELSDLEFKENLNLSSEKSDSQFSKLKKGA